MFLIITIIIPKINLNNNITQVILLIKIINNLLQVKHWILTIAIYQHLDLKINSNNLNKTNLLYLLLDLREEYNHILTPSIITQNNIIIIYDIINLYIYYLLYYSNSLLYNI